MRSLIVYTSGLWDITLLFALLYPAVSIYWRFITRTEETDFRT